MAPYLATVTSFANVPQTDAGVDTLQFLEASKGLVGIFDLLASTVLTVVSNDLNGNIAKVRARYDEAPEKSATLEELVKNEIAENKSQATQGLLWLTRGLAFTCKALKATQQDPTLELSTAFQNAYGDTLRPYHSFLVKPIFSAAMKACPKRDDLYTKLAEDKTGDTVTTEEYRNQLLDDWLAALDLILVKIDAFYEENKYKKVSHFSQGNICEERTISRRIGTFPEVWT
ncbi:hypothetical protein EW145_g4009 [Phellinidium pouzarii]|uniref:Glycolipid transfer protein domain-containing protein n=1 Tax=Phellinidium pouzarii TaxID=167371 RepID=A0A4S4L5B2_9AGAM|nr:hypothetical protein EW145_g4009 [Phellinidium pouzarii]